jgi:hypothetical protein
MLSYCPFLSYLQAQTVGLPVTMHSTNVRLMRSTLLPQASNVEAFSFPASSCQAEAAFMEEERVDTPKVCVGVGGSGCVWLHTSVSPHYHFLRSLRNVVGFGGFLFCFFFCFGVEELNSYVFYHCDNMACHTS